MKLVFIGGKGAPSGYTFGQVYELPERYASFKHFEAAPADSTSGQIVPVKPKAVKANEKKPLVRKKLTIAPGFTGKVKLRFDGKAKSAPKGAYLDGQVYELPARYASFPWFDLVEPIPELKIETIESDSVFKDDKPFVPRDNQPGIQAISLEEMRHPEKMSRDQPTEEAPIEETVDEKPASNISESEAKNLAEESKPKEEKALEHKPFNEMTKDELAAYVKEKGGEVTERDNKRTLTGKALALDQA